MAKKSSSSQTTKAEGNVLKSLVPVLIFSTAAVLLIGFIGRKVTEK